MAERWNKDIKVIDPHELLPEEKREGVKELMEPQLLEFVELEKTDEERKMIDTLNQGIERVLRNLGLEPVQVLPESVHLLNEDEFRRLNTEQFGNEDDGDCQAFFYRGHIFAPKRSDQLTWVTINDLVHEFAHAISYQTIRVFVRPRNEKGKIPITPYIKRTGYGFNRKGPAGFLGFNEGMTELFASDIRVETKDDFGMSEAEKDAYLSIHAYYPQIVLVDYIFSILGKNDPEMGYVGMKNVSLKSMITGDMSFLKKLEKIKKGSIKILTEMGHMPEDALKAAEQLGFNPVVKEIKSLLEWKALGGNVKKGFFEWKKEQELNK